MKVVTFNNGVSRDGRLKRSGKNWCPSCKVYTSNSHKCQPITAKSNQA